MVTDCQVKTGEIVHKLKGHALPVYSVAFSPNGWSFMCFVACLFIVNMSAQSTLPRGLALGEATASLNIEQLAAWSSPRPALTLGGWLSCSFRLR